MCRSWPQNPARGKPSPPPRPPQRNKEELATRGTKLFVPFVPLVANFLSQSEQLFSQQPRLQSTHPEFLIVVQDNRKRPARHRNNPTDHFDIDQRSAAQAHKSRRLEPRREIAQSVADR